MKIAVLGAGAMGSVYGARLARGGADVILLDVNDAHLDAIGAGGLRISIDEGDHVVDLPAVRPEAFGGPVDVFLLFTKIFHTDRALAAVAGLLDDTHVLSLQNGIGNAERIAAHVAREKVMLGMTMTPAKYLGPGRVESRGPATTAFFSLDGADRPILHKLAAAMQRGGIDATPDPQIQAAIWEKAAFNCAMNALCALADATPGAIGRSLSGRDLASRVAAEAIAVACAAGVDASAERVEDLIDHACDHHLHHEPSMLQDRKAQRQTEIDALNGAVAEMGERLGVPVAANRTAADLVRLMEDAVRFRAENV